MQFVIARKQPMALAGYLLVAPHVWSMFHARYTSHVRGQQRVCVSHNFRLKGGNTTAQGSALGFVP
jgi:hypothetical protein